MRNTAHFYRYILKYLSEAKHTLKLNLKTIRKYHIKNKYFLISLRTLGTAMLKALILLSLSLKSYFTDFIGFEGSNVKILYLGF